MRGLGFLALAVALGAYAQPALAQRADENATRAAGDAFGTNIGLEKVGLYTNADVRGFNPSTAGNLRWEGLYFDFRLPPPPQMAAGSQVRVGLTALAYPFPAPTGIVDFSLRPAGDQPYLTNLIQLGPNSAYDFQLDGGKPIIKGVLAVSAGFNYRQDEEQPGDDYKSGGLRANASWRPAKNIRVRPFFGYYWRPEKKAQAQVFAAGHQLPVPPESRNYDPSWTHQYSTGFSLGVLGDAVLDRHWTLRAGLQRFGVDDDGAISDSYLNTGVNGVAAVRRFANQRQFYSYSWSGEGRLSGVFTGQRYEQVVHLSLRGRDVERTFGGAAQVSFANVPIGQYNAPPEPAWVFGAQSLERIHHYTASASYLWARRGVGTLGLGVQKVQYREEVTTGGRLVGVEKRDDPVFWNGSASLTPTRRLALYAAFTQGLEEAPIAPDVATNAQEAPAAVHTKQKEAGLRYIITPTLRLVVGYFDVRKPYFSLDPARLWRSLGEEQHKGIEVSLTGELFHGFNIVGGYVRMDPKVVGFAVDAGLIGPEPISQPKDTLRLNFDYRSDPSDPLSLEGAWNYFGERPFSARTFTELGGKQPQAPAYSTLDLGARYRFHIGQRRSTLRVQVLNIFDAQEWQVQNTGGVTVTPPRRYMLTLATDF